MNGENSAMPMNEEAGQIPAFSLRAEHLAYAALFLLALVIRVADLDITPMTEREARLSLQAWHIIEDDAPGAAAISDSPLTLNTQILSYSLLGASEFSARIGAALAGLALAFTPLLFRETFGPTRAFVSCVLLSVLTLPVAASRLADGAVWLPLFALLATWLIRRYWYSQQLRDAALAALALTCLALLSSPGGPALLLILALAGWLAVWRTALSAPQRLDLPGDDILQLAVKRLVAFPFQRLLPLPVIAVVLVSTIFLLNPSGLGSVGQLIESALDRFTISSSDAEVRRGFVALLSHETLLIVFAIGGAWLLWKKGDVTYLDRFAAGWAAIGALALLLYPGAGPADGMWVALPLTLLASYGITQLMVDRRVVALWSGDGADEAEGDDSELFTTRFWWVKWALSFAVFFFLMIMAAQLAQASRMMLALPPLADLGEAARLVLGGSQPRLLQAVALLAITAIIGLTVFALIANYWGWGACLQGLGLGFLWLMLLSGIGGAWQTSSARAATPDGLWRERATTDEAALLRTTLFELARRESAGFPLFELVLLEDESEIINRGGLLAWLTRDFPNAAFAPSAAAAAGKPIVLMAENGDQAALKGDYVGQRFVLRRAWTASEASLGEVLAWWTQGRARREELREEAVILWLRQDVYDGAPKAAPLG